MDSSNLQSIQGYVLGSGVHVRVHTHDVDAQFSAGPGHPDGDLSAVRDQDRAKHATDLSDGSIAVRARAASRMTPRRLPAADPTTVPMLPQA